MQIDIDAVVIIIYPRREVSAVPHDSQYIPDVRDSVSLDLLGQSLRRVGRSEFILIQLSPTTRNFCSRSFQSAKSILFVRYVDAKNT